jgi:WD40 repeat protein
MLVVATNTNHVLVLDESDNMNKRRTFQVKVTYTCKPRERDASGSIGHVKSCASYHTNVDFPVAVVSVNGAVLATKDTDNCFSTWDIATGLFIRRFKGHDDSSCMEAVGCKCMPWLQALPASECPAVGHRAEIVAMAFSHRGDRIVSADTDGVILLWDAETAVVLHKDFPNYSSSDIVALAFSPDGNQFVVTDSEGFAVEFSAVHGGHLNTPFYPSNCARSRCQMCAVVWAPNSKNYICGYERGQVKTVGAGQNHFHNNQHTRVLWRKRSADERSPDSVLSLAISPDGKLVAVAGCRIIESWRGHEDLARNGFVAVYDSRDNALMWKNWSKPGKSSVVRSISFSLDGKLLASGGDDCFCRVWDPRDGIMLHAIDVTLDEPVGYVCVVSVTWCLDKEQTPKTYERRVAFAQGDHKRLGVESILQQLPDDVIARIGKMI